MITLLGENISGRTPSVEDLADWADTFGLHHPVVADPNWQVTARFVDGYSIALPSMQQLAAGMEILRRDTQVSESQIRGALP